MTGSELCAVCNEQPHKYTCPRCKLKSCSAECSKAHKAAGGCSGERNKAAYVPMNEYGWGTLMDDYTFLEDLGRKADEWGRDIARKGFLVHQQQQSARGGRGRGGAQQHRTAATRADGRRHYLKTQLDIRDIEIDLLPAGMARRKLNQSFWDSRSKTAMLTLELVFHSPRDTLALVTNPPPPITLLTHRNDFARPLGDLVRASVSDHAKRKNKSGSPLPDWATGLVSVEEGSDSVTLYLIADTSATTLPGTTKAFRKLDPALKLSRALRNTNFVEFPTIHLWDEEAFTGTLVDGPARADPDGPPPVKRRKVDASKGKTNMLALVGDYASEEDDEEEDAEELPEDDDTAREAMAEYGPDSDQDQDQDQDQEQEPEEGLDWRDLFDQAGVGSAAPDLAALLDVEDDATSTAGPEQVPPITVNENENKDLLAYLLLYHGLILASSAVDYLRRRLLVFLSRLHRDSRPPRCREDGQPQQIRRSLFAYNINERTFTFLPPSLFCSAHQSSMSDDKSSSPSSVGAADIPRTAANSHMVDETQKSELPVPAKELQDAASSRWISSCQCEALLTVLGVWLATCLAILAMDAWFLRHGLIDERRTWLSTVDESRTWMRWVALRWPSIYSTAWEALYALWGVDCALLAGLMGTTHKRERQTATDPTLRNSGVIVQIVFTVAPLVEVLGVVLHFCGLLDPRTGRPAYFASVYGICKVVAKWDVILVHVAMSFVGVMDFVAYCRGTPRLLPGNSEARKEL